MPLLKTTKIHIPCGKVIMLNLTDSIVKGATCKEAWSELYGKGFHPWI